MGSIRLRKDQIQKMKQYKIPASDILDAAVCRFEKNEIAIQNTDKPQNIKIVLQIFSVRRKYKYSSEMLRHILDAHFARPVNFTLQIAELDKEIESLFRLVGTEPIILKAVGEK